MFYLGGSLMCIIIKSQCAVLLLMRGGRGFNLNRVNRGLEEFCWLACGLERVCNWRKFERTVGLMEESLIFSLSRLTVAKSTRSQLYLKVVWAGVKRSYWQPRLTSVAKLVLYLRGGIDRTKMIESQSCFPVVTMQFPQQ
uniref:Uncharacterized protein n=1 Tax=Timema genevievae TaxID=629358 RepID=A0A7R9PGK5_TIMGE|nr:unnamed protein product [Timema genevievae]